MKKFFTISEAAKIADMTSETLRHYDRIGLVSPCEKDEWTGYRYYSEQEIIRLNTIQALRHMDLSLREIKALLELQDLAKIIEFLRRAEKSADDKIAKLQYAKTKIQLARSDYEKKLRGAQQTDGIFTQQLPRRVILLSDTLYQPTVDNLWNYHSHFYDQIPDGRKEEYTFEDLAGIYTRDGRSHLFALCLRHPDSEGLTPLPAGQYLCAPCTEETREQVRRQLVETAEKEHHRHPEFILELVVITGVLQWNYQIQIYLGPPCKKAAD